MTVSRALRCPQLSLVVPGRQLLTRDHACRPSTINPQPSYIPTGIKREVWSFPDGEPPPKDIIDQWLDLCLREETTVAIHCVAGLGRAPLMVKITADCMLHAAGLPLYGRAHYRLCGTMISTA